MCVRVLVRRDNAKLVSARVIDGHVDLPIFVRELYGNNINKIDLEEQVRSPNWYEGIVGLT